ncbi:polymeric immunoglobulin receptor-like isoform X2 [Alosa pseudoharengus]|uniref:polymeric immunoglobulin receptor-like isoform X2 n=1 Tax=Alosa pseudoharengus TaxID=34774 RepID=UPI003F891FC9
MKNLIVLLIYLISCYCKVIKKETGPPAGVVTIKCPYDAQYVDRHKYFCRGTGCDIIVSDEESRQPTSQRLNLTDHKQDRDFLVTMTNLTGEDTGVYWCAAGGASPSDTPDLLMEVHIQVIGDVGDSATFRCPYAEGYQNYSKCLCKGTCDNSGTNCLIKSEQGQTQAKNGNETLYDDTAARVFSVTVRGLKAEYSGKYSCAVITGVNIVTTEQELLVREVVVSDEGKSVIITCKYQKVQTSETKFKYFCRAKDAGCKFEDFLVSSLAPNQGRYILKEDKNLQPESSARTFNVTITDLRAEDSGIYWCGEVEGERKTVVRLEVNKASTNVTHIPDKSTTWPSSPASMSPVTPVTNSTSPGSSPMILSVSLIVVVVVVATAVFLLYRHKRNRTQELPSNDTNTRRNSQVPQPDCMYEEIKDTHNPSLPETNTVYATAQLPTMPSDDLTYSTATLPTNPCTDMGYSAVSFGEGPNTAAIAFRQGNCEYSRTSSDQ